MLMLIDDLRSPYTIL